MEMARLSGPERKAALSSVVSTCGSHMARHGATWSAGTEAVRGACVSFVSPSFSQRTAGPKPAMNMARVRGLRAGARLAVGRTV